MMVSTSPLQKGRSCSLAVWKLYLATHSVPVDHGAWITRDREEPALITVISLGAPWKASSYDCIVCFHSYSKEVIHNLQWIVQYVSCVLYSQLHETQ